VRAARRSRPHVARGEPAVSRKNAPEQAAVIPVHVQTGHGLQLAQCAGERGRRDRVTQGAAQTAPSTTAQTFRNVRETLPRLSVTLLLVSVSTMFE
jgi:hypothetical protein